MKERIDRMKERIEELRARRLAKKLVGEGWSRKRKLLTLTYFVVLGLLAAAVVGEVVDAPSEVSNFRLILLLVAIIGLSWGIVWGVLTCVERTHHRLGLAGIGLLLIGIVLACFLLPDKSTSAPVEGMSMLPPFAASRGHEFALGLAANPQGCANPVSVTLVADGSSRYWAEHKSQAKAPQRFALVLPGRLSQVEALLGFPRSGAEVATPERAQVDSEASGDVEDLEITRLVGRTDRRELTVITGYVRGWLSEERPLIVKAGAPWLTYRGPGDCNLQLPALLGELSVATLFRAFTCEQVEDAYRRGVCSAETSADGTRPSATGQSPALEVNDGVSVVGASDVSFSSSDPRPETVDRHPAWKCKTSSTGGPIGGADCHATVAVVVTPWHRDFLLALIGAFIAVGVHMLFQATVDYQGREDSNDPGDGQG